MRVLYVLNAYPQISETYIKTELKWVTRDHTVRIVAMSGGDITYKNHLPHEVISSSNHARLEEIAREFQPEMVHGHYIHIAPWCMHAARTAGCRFTIRAHSFDVLGESLTRFKNLPHALNSRRCAGILTFPFTRQRIIDIGVHPSKLTGCWPVVDVGAFLNQEENGKDIMNVGAAIEKKAMESYVDMAKAIPGRRFNLYSLGYLTDKLKQYNDRAGNPVHFVNTVEPEDMPPEYKKHEWLVYTGDPQYNTVGWPLAVAEAQASGVGVIMRNLRPDLARYVGPGFLYDTERDIERLVSQPFPEEMRQQAFEHAKRSDVANHIKFLYRLWQSA